MPIREWINASLKEMIGLSLVPVTPEISLQSCDLAGYTHGDPADQIIIATAIYHQVTLATGDKAMLKYAKKHSIEILPLA